MLGCVFENIPENIFKYLVVIMKKKKKKKGGRGFQNEGKTKDLKRRSIENERVVEWCWVECGVENVVPNSLEFV